MNINRNLLLLVSFLSLASPSFGSLVLTLTPSMLSGIPGPDPLTFVGTLVDNDGDDSFMFLNDISVSFNPSDGNLTVDPTGQAPSSPNTYFFNTVPGTLIGDNDPVDNSYSGPIFQVYIAPNTPMGIYSGTIEILGGYNDNTDSSVLATQNFQVEVTPEPGVAGLTLAGLLGLAIVRFRRCPRVR